MRIETKFLRLRGPVTLGSLFGDWRVCWLGGWTKHRIYYLVMVCRVTASAIPERRRKTINDQVIAIAKEGHGYRQRYDNLCFDPLLWTVDNRSAEFRKPRR